MSGTRPDADRLATILTGRHFCQSKPPATLAMDPVSVLAAWQGADQRYLTVIDADHPHLREIAAQGDPVPREEVLARLRELPPAGGPGMADGWTVHLADRTLHTPLEPALLPTAPEWTNPAVALAVTLRVSAAHGPWVVEHHRSPTSQTPSEAGLELLQLLALFTSASRAACVILEEVLAGQPLATVSVLPDAGPHRYLGERVTRTAIPADDSAAFVWDRRAVGGGVHVIDAAAPLLASVQTRNKKGDHVVPIGAPFAKAGELLVPPELSENALIAVPAKGSGWAPVPAAAVLQEQDGWKVVIDPNARSSEVSRLILGTGGRTLVYDVGPGLDVRSALARLTEITIGLRGLAVTAQDAWAGASAAVAATVRRAELWLGKRRSPVDRDAVDQVTNAVLRNQSDPELLFSLKDALARVGVEDLQERRYGSQVVALLVLERELGRRFQRDVMRRNTRRKRLADADVFADALTAYLVALNQSSTETWPWAWQRIIRYLQEFLGRRRLPQRRELSITPAALPQAVRPQWEQLARRMPWIRWLADPSLDPPAGVTLSPAGLVDLLVLLRPRQAPVVTGVRRHSADMRVETVPLPPRFAQLYRAAAPRLSALVLNQLAEALSPLLHDPGQCARMVQALPLPPALDAAVRERVAGEIEHQTSPEHLLAVRADDHESPRVLLANLSPNSGLHLYLNGEPTRLAPCAVEQEGAFDYCTLQRIPPEGHVMLGTRHVPLDAERAPLAESANVTLPALPADLFRGREHQLTQLRRVVAGSGPRAGSLIFGTRRAGKSALAYQVSQDPLLRGRLWIDLSNTPTSVRDFAGWNRAICRMLVRQVRRRLGVALDTDGADVIELLADLDDALDGGAPVVVVLDELDVLLLPEQGGDGRRTAGRLGNLSCRNLVLIGTVQRFHRSVHEFKTWQSIECPADLSWADGITYFLGPLADRTAGPRVEWLRRAGVSPQHFTTEIVPRIGLRPYFWARLRNSLDGHVHDDRAGSRLVGAPDVRRYLDRLIVEDPHLNTVMDDGTELDPDERRRRDLFSVEERRILAQFAAMPATGQTLKVAKALRVGGEAALAELIDRAYLTYTDDGAKLRTAVPIYHDFLRARATDLLAVTPGAEPAPVRAAAKPSASSHIAWTARPAATSTEDIAQARAALMAALNQQNPLPLGTVGEVIRDAVPEIWDSRWAGTGSLTRFLLRFLPEFPHVGITGNVHIHRPGTTASPTDQTNLSPADIELARAAVHQVLAIQSPVPLSTVGQAIRIAAPAIPASDWAGLGKLTRFLARYLPEFRHMPGPSGDAYLEAAPPAGADHHDDITRTSSVGHGITPLSVEPPAVGPNGGAG